MFFEGCYPITTPGDREYNKPLQKKSIVKHSACHWIENQKKKQHVFRDLQGLCSPFWGFPSTSPPFGPEMSFHESLLVLTLGPQNHEKWRFWTPNIWVMTSKNDGCGFPWYVYIMFSCFWITSALDFVPAVRPEFCREKCQKNPAQFFLKELPLIELYTPWCLHEMIISSTLLWWWFKV